MQNLILNLLLLVLEISFDFNPDASHKDNRFSKTLLEKNNKFVSVRKNGIIIFNLNLMLLSTEADLILEKQGHKKDALTAYSSGPVKIVLALLTKVIAFHIGATIVQI